MRSSQSPARTRRRSRRIAGLAAVAALAIGIAGCSTAGGDDAAGPPINGITQDTVKVGFTIVDLGELAQTLGFKQANYGGVAAMSAGITAIVDYINANGGMGGRQVQPVIKSYLGSGDSPAQTQELCSGYTQDEQVFAVVMDGMFQTNGIPCYVAANTIIIDETLIAHDQQQFEANSPYLWSPTHPEYAGFMKAQLEAMNTAGFFTGNTGVSIVTSDDEVSRRTTETVVKPYLTELGVTRFIANFVDSTNISTLGQTSDAAIAAGRTGGYDRVIVVGGARIEAVALSSQEAVNYPSRWSVSTYDNPFFTENNPESITTSLRLGMTGLGYQPAQDVSSTQPPPFPDPTNANQVLCTQIVNAAGATPPDNARTNWKNVLQYCDAAFFLKAALDQLADEETVNGEQFKEAVAGIGDVYKSSITFSSQWGPGVFAGTNGAQPLSWDEACLCFRYTGSTVTFATTGTGIPASEPPATTAPSAPVASAAPSAPAASAPVATAPAATAPVATAPVASAPAQ
jgi:ABC-type branched-subunit amino acid transport system substrate-binding protein